MRLSIGFMVEEGGYGDVVDGGDVCFFLCFRSL